MTADTGLLGAACITGVTPSQLVQTTSENDSRFVGDWLIPVNNRLCSVYNPCQHEANQSLRWRLVPT